MSRTKFPDGDKDEALSLFRLLFSYSDAPLIEFFIPLHQQDNMGIIRDSVTKLRVFSDISIKLHTEKIVSFFL